MNKNNNNKSIVPEERIEQTILIIRNQKVILDSDLASLYGVETKAFNRAIKRNMSRFPKDFMFQLTKSELENLRCQFGTSSYGGRRYLPYAFTEHGALIFLQNSRQLAAGDECGRVGRGSGKREFPCGGEQQSVEEPRGSQNKSFSAYP